jgi:hypothetical protein
MSLKTLREVHEVVCGKGASPVPRKKAELVVVITAAYDEKKAELCERIRDGCARMDALSLPADGPLGAADAGDVEGDALVE